MTEITVCEVEYICRAGSRSGKASSDYTTAVLSGPDGRQRVLIDGFYASPDGYEKLRSLYVRHEDLAV